MVLTLRVTGTSGYLRESWDPFSQRRACPPCHGVRRAWRGREVGCALLSGTRQMGHSELPVVVLCQTQAGFPVGVVLTQKNVCSSLVNISLLDCGELEHCYYISS